MRSETFRAEAGCDIVPGIKDPVCRQASDVSRDNEPCQSGVADGFFQTGDRSDGNVPEDFPVLVFAGGKWGVETETSTANNSGFLDCRPDIENVVLDGNISFATRLPDYHFVPFHLLIYHAE